MHAEHFELHADDYEDLMNMDTTFDDDPAPTLAPIRVGSRVRVTAGHHEGELGEVTDIGEHGTSIVQLDCLTFAQPGFELELAE